MSSEESKNTIRQVLPLTGTIYGLHKEEIDVTCPACKVTAKSVVEKQTVTISQHCLTCFIVCAICCLRCKRKECKKCARAIENNGDFNHYCSNCGCFLGRYDQYYGGKEFLEI